MNMVVFSEAALKYIIMTLLFTKASIVTWSFCLIRSCWIMRWTVMKSGRKRSQESLCHTVRGWVIWHHYFCSDKFATVVCMFEYGVYFNLAFPSRMMTMKEMMTTTMMGSLCPTVICLKGKEHLRKARYFKHPPSSVAPFSHVMMLTGCSCRRVEIQRSRRCVRGWRLVNGRMSWCLKGRWRCWRRWCAAACGTGKSLRWTSCNRTLSACLSLYQETSPAPLNRTSYANRGTRNVSTACVLVCYMLGRL